MSKFVFSNRMLKLDIAGAEFEFDAKNGDNLSQKKEKILGYANAYRNGEKTESETIEFYAKQINEALSDDNAFQKIFKNRQADVRDCLHVMTYIAKETTAFYKQITEEEKLEESMKN